MIFRYWADIWTKTSSLAMTFDHMTWKSIGNIYSLRATTVLNLAATSILTLDHVTWKLIGKIYSLGETFEPSLATFKQRDQNTLSGYLFKNHQYDLDLWPCDLKIKREHPFSRGIQCTKFGNSQAKGSKDIEQTSLGLQSCKTICLLFFKGGA